MIRDHNGSWVLGFARARGIASSVEVELWALWDGLRLCVEKKFHAVEVELDTRVVVDWMTDRTRDNIAYSILISDYKYLINLISTVVVKHCYREANQWTDKLARLGGTQQLEFSIFERPRVDTRLLLYYNAIGMYGFALTLFRGF